MKTIIIINGQGGSGKDTFIKLCAKNSDKSVCSFSSISPYNEVAKMLGWNGVKDEVSRKFLSDLKYISSEYNNYPNKYLLYSVNRAPEDSICFLHIREPEQIENCIEMFEREGYNPITLLLIRYAEPKEFGNVSDDFVFDYEYDYIISNDKDLNKLEDKSVNFMKRINIL